jgi:hypothetical protein
MESQQNDNRSCSSSWVSRIVLGIIVAAYLTWIAWFPSIGILIVPVFLVLLAVYIQRYALPRGFRTTWLVLGALLGAFIGSAFSGDFSDRYVQRVESAIHTVEGALLGTLVGIAVDIAKNRRSGRIRFRFLLWHVLAYLWICAVGAYLVVSLIDLLRLRSVLCGQ